MKRRALLPISFLACVALSPLGIRAQQAAGSTTFQDAAGNTVTVTSRHPVPAQEDLHAEFAALDANSDGSVSPAEARADKYLARSFRLLDTDHDARLRFEELRDWLDD